MSNPRNADPTKSKKADQVEKNLHTTILKIESLTGVDATEIVNIFRLHQRGLLDDLNDFQRVVIDMTNVAIQRGLRGENMASYLNGAGNPFENTMSHAPFRVGTSPFGPVTQQDTSTKSSGLGFQQPSARIQALALEQQRERAANMQLFEGQPRPNLQLQDDNVTKTPTQPLAPLQTHVLDTSRPRPNTAPPVDAGARLPRAQEQQEQDAPQGEGLPLRVQNELAATLLTTPGVLALLDHIMQRRVVSPCWPYSDFVADTMFNLDGENSAETEGQGQGQVRHQVTSIREAVIETLLLPLMQLLGITMVRYTPAHRTPVVTPDGIVDELQPVSNTEHDLAMWWFQNLTERALFELSGLNNHDAQMPGEMAYDGFNGSVNSVPSGSNAHAPEEMPGYTGIPVVLARKDAPGKGHLTAESWNSHPIP